jgi:hypothetical protein
MEACNEDTNSVSLLAPTDDDTSFGGKDCVMSVVDKVSKSKPTEVIHKESNEDENENETNCSNVTSEFVNDDGKEESDDDTTIEENDTMSGVDSGVDDSKLHESDKESSSSSSYNIPDDILKAAVQAALDDVLNQHTSNKGSDSDDEDDGRPFAESTDIEIVGLHSCTNGRSWSIHEVCGDFVEVGDLLRLVPTCVTINGKDECAIKLVRLMDEVDGCTVAFIPRILMDLPRVQKNILRFCMVKELYRDSENSFKRHKDHRNMGCASCYFIDDIPISE